MWARKGRQISLLKKTSYKVSLISKQGCLAFVHNILAMINRLEYLQTLLKESPNDSFVLFALAKEYEGQHAHNEAFEHYLKLKIVNPDYVGLYYHLGKLYEQSEDFPSAIEVYKEGIQISQKIKDQHAFSELREALFNLEDPDE